LLLCTDGLAERRGEVLNTGLQRLADSVTTVGPNLVHSGLDALIEMMVEGTQVGEDLCVLALHRSP